MLRNFFFFLHFGFVAFNGIIEIVNCPNFLMLLLLTICLRFLAAAWEGDASATEGKEECLTS